MGGYTKHIAVIKGIKEGFSADGGELTGLVKAESYAKELKIEISLINFAPLTDGRYVTGISDGVNTVIVENCKFEGEADIDIRQGFAAVICYVNGQVSAIASAICGGFGGAALSIKQEIEKAEKVKTPSDGVAADYEDEAIAEVNYYEFAETDKGADAVRKVEKEEKKEAVPVEDETASCAVEEDGGVKEEPLCKGEFYLRLKDEIEGLLAAYPRVNALEKLIDGSRFVSISYGENKYYIFGVIYDCGKPQYICYGVPAKNGDAPPESMAGLASFLPLSEKDKKSGYWIMYQDADTGATIHLEVC